MVEPTEDRQRDDRCSAFRLVDFSAVGCVLAEGQRTDFWVGTTREEGRTVINNRLTRSCTTLTDVTDDTEG
jgi:hypothetical protein